MDWQPDQQIVIQLIQLFFNTQSSDNAIQQENNAKLAELQKLPNLANYLVFVLTQMPDQPAEVRAVSGLLLKNKVSQDYKSFSESELLYLKNQAINSMGDPDSLVRHTLGTVISSIVIMGGINQWPEALSRLFDALDSSKYEIVEGAWDTLRKICEDQRSILDQPFQNGQVPMELMFQKFLTFFSSQYPILKVHAISTLNIFVQSQSSVVQPYIDIYVTELFKQANDTDIAVRKAVCKAIVSLLEVHTDKLIPEIENVVAYMLYSTQAEDQDLAMEACEFWLSFSELEDYIGYLKPHLASIIPVLFQKTVYAEEDLILLNVDENDADIADDNNIKPRHHKARLQGNAENINAPKNQNEINDSDEEDYDDDDDEDGDDIYTEWSLRKCAAASIDTLATVFKDETLPFLLPVLNEALFSDDWVKKESGILCLGAIAEGCSAGINDHLPSLLPYLISAVSDKYYLVRSISCWTTSRYSAWIVLPQNKHFFEQALQALLKAMLDNNKRVQEAACSAFATLEETAGELMVPYLEPVIQTLVVALSKYQSKNLIILYDSIGTLAESVGLELSQARFIDMLMPNLMNKFLELSTIPVLAAEEPDTFPLLECMSSIALSLGQSFKPYASTVFYYCMNLIQETHQQYEMAMANPDEDIPDKDLINVSLDLISATIQALASESIQLFNKDPTPPLLQLLGVCLTDSSSEVRQSAFALLGDLTIHVYELVGNLIPFFMERIIEQVDPEFTFVNVCNNAIWASGEISIRSKNQITQYLPNLLAKIIPILKNDIAPLALRENAAIALGRFGYSSPETVAPLLESFIETYCHVLKNVSDEMERSSSLEGMLSVVSLFGEDAKAQFIQRF